MYILGVACTWLSILCTPVGVYLYHTYHSQRIQHVRVLTCK